VSPTTLQKNLQGLYTNSYFRNTLSNPTGVPSSFFFGEIFLREGLPYARCRVYLTRKNNLLREKPILRSLG